MCEEGTVRDSVFIDRFDWNSRDGITSSAGFITPQVRDEAKRVWTGNTELLEHFPQSAPRGAELPEAEEVKKQ